MTVDKASISESGISWYRVFSLIAALTSFALLVLVYANLDRGLDLTDESYYLLWLAHPDAYDLAASTFGYFLSPIYDLLGSDPAAFRRFGLVGPALTAILVAWLALRASGGQGFSRFGSAAVALAVGTTVVTYYSWWLPTPSYNWLPLPAAFLLMAALTLVHTGKAFWPSVFLVGFAGLLAFAGKPSTAGGFAFIYGIGMLILRGISPFTLRHIALSALCCGLLFLCAFLTIMDASIALSQARAYVEFFGVGPATGGIFQGAFGPLGYYVIMALAIASYWTSPTIGRVCGIVAILAIGTVVFSLRGMPYHSMQGMLVMSTSLVVVANSLAWTPNKPDGRLVLVISLGHILPWFIAFGTSNVIVAQVGIYVALPLTAAIITACLCFGFRDWRAFAAALIAPLFATASLYSADLKPYRIHPGLSLQEFPVQVAGGILRVDAATRAFIMDLRDKAAAAGFVPGTPVLDFSGDTPGVALLLDGQAPYFPWMVGGYDFSEPLASTIVGKLTPEQRQAAWLVHNDAPRPFELDFIASLGFDLESDYKIVASPIHPLYGEQVRIYAPASAVPAQ